MSTKLPVSVIVLTYNEELNLAKCLKSSAPWAREIVVVDSGSTDGTVAVAKEFGAKVYEHPFKNQAEQFNWALANCEIEGDWIFRLDADEEITPELWEEIAAKLPKTPPGVSGFLIKRRVYFLGRWMRHGGYYPTWFLRLFRKGQGRSEVREMDEHILLLKGRAEQLANDFVDRNLKGLHSWTAKHNDFSTREVAARLREHSDLRGPGAASVIPAQAGIQGQALEKRWLKNWYLKLPLFWRSFGYFQYRYFLRLGFLDGKEGLIFHFLQACWHQFLIDAKTYEAERS